MATTNVYMINFTRTSDCSITIEADTFEEAKKKFERGEYDAESAKTISFEDGRKPDEYDIWFHGTQYGR